MNYLTNSLSALLILIQLLIGNVYGDVRSKYPDVAFKSSNFLLQKPIAQKNTLNHLDEMIKKKRVTLLKTKKSDTKQYTSLYDDLAKLTISKNKRLLEMDKVDLIDTDKTCNLAMEYEEIEFIKTQYYKTPFHDEVAYTLKNIASLYEQCHPTMAEKYLKLILEIKEHIYLKGSAQTAKAHDDLGDYYRIYMANFKKAIKEYEAAKRIREKLYDIKNPLVTQNYERLSLSLYYYGDKTSRAENLLLESIKIREQAFPRKEFPLYVAYMDLGIYYSMKDKYKKSIFYLNKALKKYEGQSEMNYIVITSEVSQIYFNQGNLYNALVFAEEAYSTSKKFYGSDTHYQVVENYLRLNEIKNKMRELRNK